MSKIFVDADACPVRQEAQKVATRYKVKIIMVSNGGIRPSNDPMVETIIVSAGADAADDWIVDNAQKNDIVITQDILLAARCLKKQVIALGNSGKEYDANNIGNAVAMRELNQHLRETGEGGSFNPSFKKNDRSQFLQALDLLVTRALAANKE